MISFYQEWTIPLGPHAAWQGRISGLPVFGLQPAQVNLILLRSAGLTMATSSSQSSTSISNILPGQASKQLRSSQVVHLSVSILM